MTFFVLIMFGFPTGDLNPICNAPMLGAHQTVQRTGASRFARRQTEPHRGLAPVADLGVRPLALVGLARRRDISLSWTMRGEFTAVIERAEEGGYWAICPEVPGANGQGETVDEAKRDLAEAIRLVLEDRCEDSLRGLPEDAIRDVVSIS